MAGSSKVDLKHVKDQLKKEFNLKDIGESKKILGIDIDRNRDQSLLYINQQAYCEKLINKFHLNEAKLVTTPIAQHFKLLAANSSKEIDIEQQKQMSTIPCSQAVGSLMYLMVSTRPNLSYATSLVSRYMSDLGKRH